MKERMTKTTGLLALAVFAAFTLCVLLVLLSGAKVYRGLATRGEACFEARTATRYVTMRVRQAENIAVADFEGCEALVISETIGGETWLTRVYCHDGYIRELYSAENTAFSPEDGEAVLPAQTLGFSVTDGLLTVHIDDRELYLQLDGKVDAP